MIIYKSGGRIKKAQHGVQGIAKPGVTPAKKVYADPSKELHFDGADAVGQAYVGDDPTDPSRYVTQGQNFADSGRISEYGDNYQGTNTMITRDEWNDYNTAQEGYLNRDMEIDEATGIATGLGADPWADYNTKYGENSVLRSNPIARKYLNKAFEDENLYGAEYSKGQFKQTVNDGQPLFVNETDGRQWDGFSRFVRNKQEIPGAEPQKATGIAPNNVQPVQGSIPAPEKTRYNPPNHNPGRGKKLKVSKRKTREQKASKKKWKKGGLLY